MHTTVAHVQPADLDALAPLFDAYRQFYGQSSDVPAARDWLRTRLRFGESRVLLARRNRVRASARTKRQAMRERHE